MYLKKKIGAARKFFNLAQPEKKIKFGDLRQIAPKFLCAKICPNKVG